MCWFVRCTARRTAFLRSIRTRVFAARRRLEIFLSSMARSLLLLRFFQCDDLAGVAHALALVGLRRLVRADLGSDLADPLAIDALDDDLGLRRRLRLHALGQQVHDRVREAEREIQLVALRLRTVADADEREALLEALAYALHHVGDGRA